MNVDHLTTHLEDPRRLATLQQIESRLQEHPFPPQLVVESTSYCNLKCIHCGHGEMTRPYRHMERGLWDKIVAEVAEHAPECEVWPTFYGEALLLRDELWERLHHAHRAGCRNLVLNSNGTLLGRWNNVEKVLDSPLKRFILSLDGFTPEVFEKVRRKARWHEVYPAVEELCRRRMERGQTYPVIMVQYSVMPENAHELEPFTAFWKARGAEVKSRPMLEWGAAGTIRTSTISHQGWDRHRIACPWANNTMAILVDGTVSACAVDYDGNFRAGDINRISIREAWATLGERIRRPHREHRWGDLPPLCQGCGDWQVAGAAYEPEVIAGTRPFWFDDTQLPLVT